MSTSKACSSCIRARQTRPLRKTQLGFLVQQAHCQRAPLQASARAKFSTTTPRQESRSLVEQPTVPSSRSRRPLLISLAAAVLAGGAWYGLGSEKEDDSLNGTKFTPFNIISKEQVSPTAFIITIRCPESVAPKNDAKIKAAWDHGLWSVEMKQPQLQIARHYTPLPPANGAETDAGELRFLIRKMDSGEMSNYLFRLQVGDQVWLRGPHYGFDVVKRMGGAKDVVFLAGGTGIAPALQIAHKILDRTESTVSDQKPSIRILWANRSNVDSLGRELSGKGKSTEGNWVKNLASNYIRIHISYTAHVGDVSSESDMDSSVPDTLTALITELRSRHGDNFKIDYFVDNERFITYKDVNAAMGNQPAARKQPSLAATDKRCRWHSHEGLAATSDEDDKEAVDSPCPCRPPNMPPEPIGRNLLCVSGPDGFIEAYAGSKRWFGGREVQGPVLGLLGSMKRMDPKMDDWLVLKL